MNINKINMDVGVHIGHPHKDMHEHNTIRSATSRTADEQREGVSKFYGGDNFKCTMGDSTARGSQDPNTGNEFGFGFDEYGIRFDVEWLMGFRPDKKFNIVFHKSVKINRVLLQYLVESIGIEYVDEIKSRLADLVSRRYEKDGRVFFRSDKFLDEHGFRWNIQGSHYTRIGENAWYEDGITLPRVAKKYKNVCQCCGVNTKRYSSYDKGSKLDERSLDHIVPLSKGGNHTWENITLLCRSCNSRKGAK